MPQRRQPGNSVILKEQAMVVEEAAKVAVEEAEAVVVKEAKAVVVEEAKGVAGAINPNVMKTMKKMAITLIPPVQVEI